MAKSSEIKAVEMWCAAHEKEFTPVHIFHAVKNEFGLTGNEMMNKDRFPYRVEARCCFTWFMRRLKVGSLEETGEWLDRDHTTIINQYHRTEDFLSIGDLRVSARIIAIFDRLKRIKRLKRETVQD